MTGLRNPWRFTIDEDLVIIGDVGWDNREEINTVRLTDGQGTDFGWSTYEGDTCVRKDECDETAVTPRPRSSTATMKEQP